MTGNAPLRKQAHGRLRTQRAAALRRLAHGQLEQGIGAQGVAVVHILVTARDREHAEAQHRRQRVDHQRRVAPLPDAARQRLGQAEPAFRPAQQDQPAVRRDQPAPKSAVTFLRLTAGRSNGSRVSSVMVGVVLSLPGEKDAEQRLSTQYQRLTPCPTSQHWPALNKAGSLLHHARPLVLIPRSLGFPALTATGHKYNMLRHHRGIVLGYRQNGRPG